MTLEEMTAAAVGVLVPLSVVWLAQELRRYDAQVAGAGGGIDLDDLAPASVCLCRLAGSPCHCPRHRR